VLAAHALHARHAAISGDLDPSETYEVTKARALAHECDELVEAIHGYRRYALARLACQRSTWPF